MSTSFESLVHEAPDRSPKKTTASAPIVDDEATARVSVLPVVTRNHRKPTRKRIAGLLLVLRTGRRNERVAAARAFGDIAYVDGVKVPEAVVPLTVALASDTDECVRQEAAWALWKIGDERAHPSLIASLTDDRSVRVREKAARALGLMGVQEAASIMIDLLSLERHVPARLRAGLAAALGFIAHRDALPVLMRATHDSDVRVRAEAVRSLGRYLIDFPPEIADRAFKILSRTTRVRNERNPFIRQAAVRGLRLSPEARANIVVCAMLEQDPDAMTREVVAEALPLWASPESEAALIAAISDDNWRVRKACARSLARSILRHGVFASAAVCEAIVRIERLFPTVSQERRLIRDAHAAL